MTDICRLIRQYEEKLSEMEKLVIANSEGEREARHQLCEHPHLIAMRGRIQCLYEVRIKCMPVVVSSSSKAAKILHKPVDWSISND